MRIVSWNINHRARERRIPDQLVRAIEALVPDVVVLTEYVPGSSRASFLDALRALGLRNILTSAFAPRENHVLIAARSALEPGDIRAPPIAHAVPSNALHVRLPEAGFELLGLRLPDYSKQPKTRRACWDWILHTAAAVRGRPFVLIGDFNTDPAYPRARCGDRIGLLKDSGWQHQFPESPPSYRTPRGDGVCIDHAFVTPHFELRRVSYIAQAGTHVLFGAEGALSDHAALLIELQLRGPDEIKSEACMKDIGMTPADSPEI